MLSVITRLAVARPAPPGPGSGGTAAAPSPNAASRAQTAMCSFAGISSPVNPSYDMCLAVGAEVGPRVILEVLRVV
jgi:hypothetical protein